MSFYPILVQLEGQTALVVGGGKVAFRKVETLRECGARVHIVSRELIEDLAVLVDGRGVLWIGQEFEESSLKGVFLVIAATDDAALNHRVSVCARERGLLVNAVDQPADCSFIVPSIVRRGDLIFAISTSGKSPALSKRLRKRLETEFGEEYGPFLELMGRLREKILSMGLTQDQNSRIFHHLAASDLPQALARGDQGHVTETLKDLLPPGLEVASFVK